VRTISGMIFLEYQPGQMVRLLLFLTLLCAKAVQCIVDTDYYDILELKPSATDAQIKKAYRQFAKRYHPDKNKDDPAAADLFADIAEAYEVLSNPDKRQLYDTRGKEGLDGSRPAGGGGDSFFSSFFGGAFGQKPQHQLKTPDVVVPLMVTLEDLYNGRVIEIEVSNQRICPHCRGSGADTRQDVQKCSACGGSGVLLTRHQIAPGMFQQIQRQCEACQGQGKLIKTRCHVCHGHKVVDGTHTYTVEVEKGMYAGQHINIARAGDQRPDMTPGDIKFELHTTPHPRFSRQGEHLHTSLQISLREALLGFHQKIAHLDDQYVTIERDEISQPGEVVTLAGKGMPHHEISSEFGNLYVTLQVVFPTTLSSTQKQGLKSLLDGSEHTEL